MHETHISKSENSVRETRPRHLFKVFTFSSNIRVEHFMRENGLVKVEMAMASKFGVMEQNMKGNGRITELMAEVNFGILMGISLMENGRMIKPVEKEFIFILMEQNMKGIGWMIYSMDLE